MDESAIQQNQSIEIESDERDEDALFLEQKAKIQAGIQDWVKDDFGEDALKLYSPVHEKASKLNL
jgi:hypothetical protein